MSKYKLKSKNRKLMSIFVFLLIFIGIVMITVGYSLWRTTIKIRGNITLVHPKPPDPPDPPPVSPGLEDTFALQGNVYLDVLSLNSGGQEFATYAGETLENNRLIATYNINSDYNRGNKDLSLSTKARIQNVGNYDWTNGRAEYSVSGSTASVLEASMNIAQSLKSGQNNNTNIHFTFIPELVTEMTVISFKITYNVNGQDAYILIDIIFLP